MFCGFHLDVTLTPSTYLTSITEHVFLVVSVVFLHTVTLAFAPTQCVLGSPCVEDVFDAL